MPFKFKISLFLLLLFFVQLFSAAVLAQPSEYKISRQEYIEKYKDEAIKEMLANGIPASITIAQGILESADGNSPLAKYANNHFGIKCHKGWTGPTFIQDDDAKNECFRKYYSANESFRDHSEFLKTRPWYAPLFELKITDYNGWAHGLKKAGYATNPKYPELLIHLIEAYKLYELDKVSEIASVTVKSDKNTPSKLGNSYETVSSRNNIKYIIAGPKETPYKIAKENGLELWQIFKYNDLNKDNPIKAGDIVYLQPKRNKAVQEYHLVEKGESLHSISQLYGVKLGRLQKRNRLIDGQSLLVGDKIYLRKRKP